MMHMDGSGGHHDRIITQVSSTTVVSASVMPGRLASYQGATGRSSMLQTF